jgi:hypothetical protein
MFVLAMTTYWTINPAFERFPGEAARIGRILASFGEIEIAFCNRAGQATRLVNPVMKALYSLRSTSQRLEVAHQLMQPVFVEHNLGELYETMRGVVGYCLKIRNQYAHCNWGDDINAGLFFADLQESADTLDFQHDWKHVDVPLLQAQFMFLCFAMELLEYLHHELAFRRGDLRENIWPMPTILSPPPLQNPEEEHVPPWLSAEQKALHLARALARRGGPPTPTSGQQALDKARAEKRAHQEEHRRKSEEGEKRAKERSDPEGH